MQRAMLDRLIAARQSGTAVALVTRLADGHQYLVGPEGTVWPDDHAPGPETLRQIEARLAADRAERIDSADGDLFIQPQVPPLRLVVVGAVHIAQALVPIARLAGYAVTVIDPRGAFASPDRFPDTTLVTAWPDVALQAAPPDRRTALVTLTHDPKLDDPALSAGLGSEAFYIGALGSRKTHAARLRRLEQAGFDAAALARIDGPVGLAIGARRPAEIAIAIMAGIIRVLHRPAGA